MKTDPADLELEEYRMLELQAKEYTEVNFRDLQLLVGLLAAFLILASAAEPPQWINDFWTFAIAQAVVYLFIVIQAARIAYVLILRRQLGRLELRLNDRVKENCLSWESEIVPTKLIHWRSLNAHVQVLLVTLYLIFFACLSVHSIGTSVGLKHRGLYLTSIGLEVATLVYLCSRLIHEIWLKKQTTLK